MNLKIGISLSLGIPRVRWPRRKRVRGPEILFEGHKIPGWEGMSSRQQRKFATSLDSAVRKAMARDGHPLP